jgi:hypothetical protein
VLEYFWPCWATGRVATRKLHNYVQLHNYGHHSIPFRSPTGAICRNILSLPLRHRFSRSGRHLTLCLGFSACELVGQRFISARRTTFNQSFLGNGIFTGIVPGPATDRITGFSQTKPKKDCGENRFQMDVNLESLQPKFDRTKNHDPLPYGRGDHIART